MMHFYYRHIKEETYVARLIHLFPFDGDSFLPLPTRLLSVAQNDYFLVSLFRRPRRSALNSNFILYRFSGELVLRFAVASTALGDGEDEVIK